MRLIDADALIETIENVCCKPCKEQKRDCNGVRCRACQYGDEIDDIDSFHTAEQPHWILCSERLPDELTEVNVTWENTEPEPYYDFVKGHCFTGTAVYFRGRWYWYSAVCVDYLREYGFSPNDEMDDAIKVLAWMPLPKPARLEGE